MTTTLRIVVTAHFVEMRMEIPLQKYFMPVKVLSLGFLVDSGQEM